MTADLIQPNDLLTRINHLERRDRTYRKIGMSLFAAALVGLFGAAQFRREAEVVEADRFVLRDADGTPRAVLGLDAKEDACLRLLDKNGNMRLELKANEIGALLAIYDKEVKPMVTVTGNEAAEDVARSASVICYREDGKKPALTLGHTPTHSGLSVVDDSSVVRLNLGLLEKENIAVLGCFDPRNRFRLALGTDNAGAIVKVFDEQGLVTFSKP